MAQVETVQKAYVTYRDLSPEDKETFRHMVHDMRSETASGHSSTPREWLASRADELSPALRAALEAVMVRGDKGPNVGEKAPDFCLKRLGGDEKVQLASFQGRQPVGLVFGSYT